MKKSIHKENLEKLHYNNFADHKTLRDTYLPSKLCRRDIIRNAFNKNFLTKKFVILDIGCGIGANALYLKDKYSKYIGVDISSEMIRIAKQFCKNLKNVEFHVSNIKDFKISKDLKIDLVLMDGALHHMTEISKIFSILKRKIDKGTIFIAREPQNANKLFQVARKIRMKIDKSYSSNQIFFSEQQLKDILNKSGMKNIKFCYSGFITPIIAQVIMKPLFIFIPMSFIFLFFERILEKILIGPLKKLSWNIVVYAKF